MPNGAIDVVIRLLQLIPYCALVLILSVVSWHVLRILRAKLSKTELKPADYLKTFQKLHEEGELTIEEYRLVRRLISLQQTRSLDAPKPDFSPPD